MKCLAGLAVAVPLLLASASAAPGSTDHPVPRAYAGAMAAYKRKLFVVLSARVKAAYVSTSGLPRPQGRP